MTPNSFDFGSMLGHLISVDPVYCWALFNAAQNFKKFLLSCHWKLTTWTDDKGFHINLNIPATAEKSAKHRNRNSARKAATKSNKKKK